MVAKKKPTAAQLAARELFAERARAGYFKKKRKVAAKKNPLKKGTTQKVVSGNIKKLVKEGMPPRRAAAAAYSTVRRSNPAPEMFAVFVTAGPHKGYAAKDALNKRWLFTSLARANTWKTAGGALGAAKRLAAALKAGGHKGTVQVKTVRGKKAVGTR